MERKAEAGDVVTLKNVGNDRSYTNGLFRLLAINETHIQLRDLENQFLWGDDHTRTLPLSGWMPVIANTFKYPDKEKTILDEISKLEVGQEVNVYGDNWEKVGNKGTVLKKWDGEQIAIKVTEEYQESCWYSSNFFRCCLVSGSVVIRPIRMAQEELIKELAKDTNLIKWISRVLNGELDSHDACPHAPNDCPGLNSVCYKLFGICSQIHGSTLGYKIACGCPCRRKEVGEQKVKEVMKKIMQEYFRTI